jgi:Fuc2NAc and GlcNAc transferase
VPAACGHIAPFREALMVFAGLLLCAIAGPAAFVVTLMLVRNADRLGVIQAPNERSSHTRPTPTGGGLGIVLAGMVAGLAIAWFEPWPALLAVAATVAIAAIGFADDRRPMPAKWRLLAQFVLAAAIVASLPLARLGEALGLPVEPILIGLMLVLGSVYWINIFNFMDGIDGLAASEAAFMLIAAAALSAGSPDALAAPHLWWSLALAAATIGFLALNFPPARIFMGDAGSTYLGLMLAYLALQSIAAGWLTVWQWLILAALFVTDATVTLLRRLMLGERVFEAHRSHAYQVLSRLWGAHRPVTLAAIGLNLMWLLPISWWAGAQPGSAWLALTVAYAPLVVGALWIGAGAPEKKSA